MGVLIDWLDTMDSLLGGNESSTKQEFLERPSVDQMRTQKKLEKAKEELRHRGFANDMMSIYADDEEDGMLSMDSNNEPLSIPPPQQMASAKPSCQRALSNIESTLRQAQLDADKQGYDFLSGQYSDAIGGKLINKADPREYHDRYKKAKTTLEETRKAKNKLDRITKQCAETKCSRSDIEQELSPDFWKWAVRGTKGSFSALINRVKEANAFFQKFLLKLEQRAERNIIMATACVAS